MGRGRPEEGHWEGVVISHSVKVIYHFVCIRMILVIEVEWIYYTFSSTYIYVCTRVCKYLCMYVCM